MHADGDRSQNTSRLIDEIRAVTGDFDAEVTNEVIFNCTDVDVSNCALCVRRTIEHWSHALQLWLPDTGKAGKSPGVKDCGSLNQYDSEETYHLYMGPTWKATVIVSDDLTDCIDATRSSSKEFSHVFL